ncbi:zf-HC2 domain-containing protein [Actinomycetospora flava]|uniref:Zf-HC2 domain-containing protein n=1 Tax=Actinomycetospora flava TaxID=3129232 RepID=A0ABU8MA95_9PSEU
MTRTPDGHPDGPAHDALREQLGAHALGQLGDDERAAVDAHLAGCASCRAELAEIAPLAGPLARVDPDAAPSPSVPPGDFAAVLGRLREEDAPVTPLPTHRRRRVPLLGAAAAAAVIGLAGVGVGVAASTAGEPPVEPAAVQALDPGIRADAGTIDHTWGVEVVLTASGFAEGQRYEVTVLDRAGRPVPAGAFRGTGAAEMVCRLNSSVLREQAGGFVVTDADGDEVLRSRFA